MRKIKMVLIGICLSLVLAGQTAYSVFNSVKADDAILKEVSANNVWLGAKLSGNIGNNDDFSDAILLNGKIIYNADFGAFKLPIISNVSLNFKENGGLDGFLTGDKGISVGIYPYRVIKDGNDFKIVLHGGLGYKLMPKDKMSITPQQTKIFGGFEVAKKVKEDSYPLTFSVTPAYLINNLDKNNFFALEATTVMPVSGGLGVLVEYVAPFKIEYKNIFRIGIILSGELR